jgi:ferredoxin--NADP+ reductase
VTHVVTQSCCNDAGCVAACPVNCIHPTPGEPGYAKAEMLYIDPDGCVDCGECVAACPVDAIVADNDLSQADRRYLDLSTRYFADPANKPYSSRPEPIRIPKVEVSDRWLRVAIVGSGPAGVFTAEQLSTCVGLDAEVHVYERLPVPWGLVRFGVAPDHQRTKLISQTFDRIAGHRNVHFHLNVEIGKHLTHSQLVAHHHAVIYTVGASGDVKLGISGEDLPGSHSAADFVAWYNGHPDFADKSFDLSGERAVVIGNGNVALDVARVLVSDIDHLARTDIADHALDALAHSNIREVVLVARRGPAQAAFTVAELTGLMQCAGFDVEVDGLEGVDQVPHPDGIGAIKASIIAELPRRRRAATGKRVVLSFLGSPAEVLGDERVSGVRIMRNELVDGGAVAQATGITDDLECGLILRSVGYRGNLVPGLPFDSSRGTLPNDRGRVVDPETRTPVTGVYAAGWIKRGPSGVIGTNRRCAEETVNALLDDFRDGRLTALYRTADDLRALIRDCRPEAIDFGGWQSIDRWERSTGLRQHRPRIKLTSMTNMLAAASSPERPPSSESVPTEAYRARYVE